MSSRGKRKKKADAGSKNEIKDPVTGTEAGESGEKSDKKVSAGGIFSSAWTRCRLWTFNGLIFFVYGLMMLVTAFVCLQLALYGAAFVTGQMQIANLDNVVNLLSFYGILTVVFGFILFFGFKIENWLISAMKKRFRHLNRSTGEIEMSRAWQERHGGGKGGT